jgi:hypothetical protein
MWINESRKNEQREIRARTRREIKGEARRQISTLVRQRGAVSLFVVVNSESSKGEHDSPHPSYASTCESMKAFDL